MSQNDTTSGRGQRQKVPYYKQVADMFIEKMEQGTAPWQKPWKPGQEQMPYNPTTGKPYRGINTMTLMMSEKTDIDPRWMTYRQAQAAGAQVQAGEKGMPIQFWQFHEQVTKTDENGKPVLDENGKEVKQTVELERPRVHWSTVFNATQIDGLPPLEQRPEKPEWELVERAEKVLQDSGAEIHHTESNRAFYRPSSDSIHMPLKSQFPEAIGYYHTALHELGHWTGHESRLNRDLSGPFGSESYAREELRAEMASVMIGAEVGIGSTPREENAAYTKSWIKALKDDPKELYRAAADAERIMRYATKTLTQERTEEQALANARPENEQYVYVHMQLADGDRIYRADTQDDFYQNCERLHTDEETVIYERLTLAEALEKSPLNSELSAWADSATPETPVYRADYHEHGSKDALNPYTLQHIDKTEAYTSFLQQRPGVETTVYLFPSDEKALETALANNDAKLKAVIDKVAPHLTGQQTEEQARQQAAPAPAQEQGKRTYINVPYKEKDEARQLGAKWDRSEKSWYIPSGVEQQPFEKWKDPHMEIFNRLNGMNREQLISQAGLQQDLNDKSTFELKVLGDRFRDELSAAREEVAELENNFEKTVTAHYGSMEEYHAQNRTEGHRPPAEVRRGSHALEEAQVQVLHLSQAYERSLRTLLFKQEQESQRQKEREGQEFEQTPKQEPAQKENREYLAVPYSERKIAKAAGALWDAESKSWYKGPNAVNEKLSKYEIRDNQDYQAPALSPREEFAETLRAAGCKLSGDHPIMDGNKHRIAVEGDRQGDRSGFYVGHLDGRPAGYVMNNRTGAEAKWKFKGYSMNEEEKANLQAVAAQKNAEREAQTAKLHESTAQRVASQIVAEFRPSTPFDKVPYLEQKGISASSGTYLNESTKTLCVPAMDVDGKVWTAQYIREDGSKRFAADGKKEGCFHPIGGKLDSLSKGQAIIIAEGYATGKTIADSTKEPVVVVFDSGNLKPVVEQLHAKYPDKGIVIAADDDKHLVNHPQVKLNVGEVKAKEAAKAVGGTVASPVFAPGEQAQDLKRFTDFNDMAKHSKLGKEGVTKQISAAVAKELSRQRQAQKTQARERQTERKTAAAR